MTIETHNTVFDEAYCESHAGFVEGEFVLFAVSDNGCGMSHEVIDNIFEPFFTTKGQNEGTGLGLATVYGIVKQNNGFINVYSEPGEGTTFRIYLPKYDGTVAKAAREDTQELPLAQGETVLLVEDDVPILKFCTTMLESLGYSVLCSDSPGKAIELSRDCGHEIDLLITDVVMPEMNGRDLSELVKEEYPELKVLFISGYTANVIAHRGVLNEGVNFIPKPFSKSEMSKKVREVLDN